jgi:hypothetical protein
MGRMRTIDADKILKEAKSIFHEHTIISEVSGTQEGVHYFRLQKPGTSTWWYQVVCAPCLIVVSGDFGELVVTPHTRSSLNWMRAIIGNADYVLKKRPSDLLNDVFDTGLARDAILARIWEIQDGGPGAAVSELHGLLENIDDTMTAERFFPKLQEADQDWDPFDYPNVQSPSHNTYLCIGALRHLDALLTARESRAGAPTMALPPMLT